MPKKEVFQTHKFRHFKCQNWHLTFMKWTQGLLPELLGHRQSSVKTFITFEGCKLCLVLRYHKTMAVLFPLSNMMTHIFLGHKI